MSIISLTTDFGNADGYVGIMKAVILSIAPQAVLVDISHEIASWNIPSAAWVIGNAVKFFPPGTIHLAVIDPGVGSSRQTVLLSDAQNYFVGPDNGSFSQVLQSKNAAWRAYRIENPHYWRPHVSTTFHGRDIMAPICAHLANGVRPERFGPQIDVDSLVRLDLTSFSRGTDSLEGLIAHVDRYGNLITNVPAAAIDHSQERWGSTVYRVNGLFDAIVEDTYASASEGRLAAIIGSHGFLEMAVCRGSAAALLNLKAGDSFTIEIVSQAFSS